MSVFVFALLIGAGGLLICATSGFLVRIWLVQHSFDMAARSPVLLLCGAVTALIMASMVLLHWLLLLGEGRGLPCYATYWTTYIWYAAGITPYVLRAVRIVVVYHSSYRYKYAGFVKWRNLRKAWVSNGLLIIGLAAIPFAASARHFRNDFGCAFFEETTALGAVTLLTAPGFMFLLYKLSQVNDAFKLRREFTCVFNVTASLTNVYLVVQVLYKSGALKESRTLHLILEVLMLSIMLNALFWMAVVTVAMHDGWCGLKTSRVIPTERRSVPSTAWSPGLTRHGVLEYLQEGGEVTIMFERFCTRNLCGESFDFARDACDYERILDIEAQFDAFVRITEQYLQPASPQEVNISSKMQAKIASLQDRWRFSALDEDARRHVLREPLKEIVKMLEENLLNKFKQTPEMLKWRGDLERQNLLIQQANSAAAEGDENMRDQLLVCSTLITQSGGEEADP